MSIFTDLANDIKHGDPAVLATNLETALRQMVREELAAVIGPQSIEDYLDSRRVVLTLEAKDAK